MVSDDSTLLGRYVRDGDEAAFAEVVRRHVDLVYGAALRKLKGNRARAEDVTQEVFAALARKAAALVKHPTLVGWLYVTVHHAAARLMRSEERREARETEVAMQQANEPASIDWNRIRPVLDEALQQLKPEERDAVLLRFFERRAFKDVGSALRLTEDAARMRTDRAVEKLRGLLARRGIESTGGALALALTEGAQAAPAGLAASVSQQALAAGKAMAVLGFMASGKWVTATAIALAVVASIGSGVEVARYQRALQRLATTNQLRTQALARIRADERSASRQSGGATATSALPDQVIFRGPVDSVSARGPGVADEMERLHPGLIAALQRKADGTALERDAQLLPRLALSPNEEARFAHLRTGSLVGMTAGQFRGQPFMFTVRGAGDGPEVQAQLADLLGPQRLKLVQDFDRSAAERSFTTAIAGRAVLAGAPLSEAQIQGLNEAAKGEHADGFSESQMAVIQEVRGAAAFRAAYAASVQKVNASEDEGSP